jgi:hypothetical protein
VEITIRPAAITPGSSCPDFSALVNGTAERVADDGEYGNAAKTGAIKTHPMHKISRNRIYGLIIPLLVTSYRGM